MRRERIRKHVCYWAGYLCGQREPSPTGDFGRLRRTCTSRLAHLRTEADGAFMHQLMANTVRGLLWRNLLPGTFCSQHAGLAGSCSQEKPSLLLQG